MEVVALERRKQFIESAEINADKPEDESKSIEPEDSTAEQAESIKSELEEMKDKYLRLYAEFENYKKKTVKEKEDLIRYANESLIYELLSIIDNLEMALKHSMEGNSEAHHALVKGVENTLRELNRTLDKFGLTSIEALGKTFDPAYHHAMSQVETADVQDNTVVEEFRKGYLYKGKVLRPSLVAVSKKTINSEQ